VSNHAECWSIILYKLAAKLRIYHKNLIKKLIFYSYMINNNATIVQIDFIVNINDIAEC